MWCCRRRRSTVGCWRMRREEVSSSWRFHSPSLLFGVEALWAYVAWLHRLVSVWWKGNSFHSANCLFRDYRSRKPGEQGSVMTCFGREWRRCLSILLFYNEWMKCSNDTVVYNSWVCWRRLLRDISLSSWRLYPKWYWDNRGLSYVVLVGCALGYDCWVLWTSGHTEAQINHRLRYYLGAHNREYALR